MAEMTSELRQKRLNDLEQYVNARNGSKGYKIAKANRMADEVAFELLAELRNEGKVMRRSSVNSEGLLIHIFYPANYAFDEGGYKRKWWRDDVAQMIQRLSGVVA